MAGSTECKINITAVEDQEPLIVQAVCQSAKWADLSCNLSLGRYPLGGCIIEPDVAKFDEQDLVNANNYELLFDLNYDAVILAVDMTLSGAGFLTAHFQHDHGAFVDSDKTFFMSMDGGATTNSGYNTDPRMSQGVSTGGIISGSISIMSMDDGTLYTHISHNLCLKDSLNDAKAAFGVQGRASVEGRLTGFRIGSTAGQMNGTIKAYRVKK